jgi:catechol 2,3-dioxygenase-like lactoylglutathione lyase family enzyme
MKTRVLLMMCAVLAACGTFATESIPLTMNTTDPARNSPAASLGYVILYVEDVAASLTFYEEAFGLTRRFYNNDAGKEYGEMESGACRLAFYSRKLVEADPALKDAVLSSAGQPPQGFEIALLTPDVSALFERAVKVGAVALAKPESKPWGQTVAWVRSKDGHVIELATPMP